MLLINLNTSTLETFLQEHPDAIFSVSAVCYCMFSSPEELFKHLEISSIADEDWVISDEANIELEPFENLYTTIL